MKDPTAAPHLRELNEKVLADREVRRLLIKLRRSSRVALVLSGGGGKGAYEALLALFDCGIRKLCSLAGTSVGGLNAALYYQMCLKNNRNLALSVWSDMNRNRVIALSLGALFKFLCYIPSAVASAVESWLRLLRYNPPGSYSVDHRISLNSHAVASTNSTWKTTIKLLLFMLILSVFSLLIYLYGTLAELLMSVFEQPDGKPSYTVFFCILFGIPFLIRYLADFAMIHIPNFSFVSNRPLRHTIEKHLEHPILAPPPVVITLADRVRPLRLLMP